MLPMSVNWPRFVEVVRSHQRLLLTSHIRPDADALGSELGMAGVLEALGKRVTIVNGQPTPPNLAFLDPAAAASARSASTSRPPSWPISKRSWCSTPAPGSNWGRWPTCCARARRKNTSSIIMSATTTWGPKTFKDTDGRSHRPAGAGRGAALGGAAHAGDCHAAVCRRGHRHRLVSLCLDQCRHVSRRGRADRRRRQSRPRFIARSTSTIRWRDCN